MNALDPRTIANILGGEVIGRDSVSVPGPGHSKADRSLSIKLNSRAPGGFVVYSHAGDDPIQCRTYICTRLGISQKRRGHDQSAPLVVTEAGDFDEARRKAFALKIWAGAIDPAGSVVERYLRDHRGLALSPDVANRTIRYH